MWRTVLICLTFSLGSASAVTVPLTLSVERICEVASLSEQNVTLRCTRGTAAPLDVRQYSGSLSGDWHLVHSERSSEGAQVYHYRLVSSGADLHFD